MEEILRQMNVWWQNSPIETKIARKKYLAILQKNLTNNEILLLLGSRRVGKTTIMKQWIDFLLKQGVMAKKILYVLLDHPDFKEMRLAEIVKRFYNLNGLDKNEKVFVFFDEIQYKKNWDQEIKALYETGGIKFILSGSAVSLITRQKNFLTGRYLKYIVHPLDFQEFKKFTNQKDIKDYLQIGGYPEYVINQDPQYLLDLIDSIVYKDIVEVYKIRQPKIVKDLLMILARSVGFKISLNKIAKILKISIETVKDYLIFLGEVYLIYEVPKFSRSLSEQIYNEKKYYFYDTGLARVLSGASNLGGLAENAMANYFKNTSKEFFYFYEDKKECDFVVKEMDKSGEFTYWPLEVKFNPQELETGDFDFNQKGLAGFARAREVLKSDQALIVTNKIKTINDKISLVPLVEFLENRE